MSRLLFWALLFWAVVFGVSLALFVGRYMERSEMQVSRINAEQPVPTRDASRPSEDQSVSRLTIEARAQAMQAEAYRARAEYFESADASDLSIGRAMLANAARGAK